MECRDQVSIDHELIVRQDDPGSVEAHGSSHYSDHF